MNLAHSLFYVIYHLDNLCLESFLHNDEVLKNIKWQLFKIFRRWPTSTDAQGVIPQAVLHGVREGRVPGLQGRRGSHRPFIIYQNWSYGKVLGITNSCCSLWLLHPGSSRHTIEQVAVNLCHVQKNVHWTLIVFTSNKSCKHRTFFMTKNSTKFDLVLLVGLQPQYKATDDCYFAAFA